MIRHSKLKTHQYSFGEWSSKLSHTGLCHHLQASVMADLIGKYRGASSYLTDECDLSEALKTLHVRYKLKTEKIDINSSFVPYYGESTGEATHVVMAIQYGVESFNLFSSQVAPDECKEDVEEVMENVLNRMINALEDQVQELAWGCLNNIDSNLMAQMKCKHYADLQTHVRQGRFIEGFHWTRKMLTAVQEQEDSAVPLVVFLCPLDILGYECPKSQDVDEELLDSCRDIFDSLSRHRMQVQAWLRNENIKMFQSFRSSLRQFDECIKKFKTLLQKSLKSAVISSRSSDGDVDAVERMMDLIQNCVFSHGNLKNWLKEKECEFELLQIIGRTGDIALTQNKNKLDEQLYSCKGQFVLMLKLPCLDHQDPQLKAMEHYVENNKRLVKCSTRHAAARERPWFMNKNAKEELTSILRRFVEHMKANRPENNNNNRTTYLVTSLLSQDLSSPRLALYQDAQCTADPYQLPVPPSDGRLINSTKTHLIVEWNCDQVKDVIGFLVQYKHGHNGEKKQFRTGKEMRANIERTTSSETLLVRVAADTLIGSSPFSPIFEFQVPRKICQAPDLVPGLVTHNSIQIKWSKPNHDPDMSVSSYQISYNPESQPNNVTQLQTKENWILLEKLEMNTKYTIRALADCGSDGQSSMSKPIVVCTSARTVYLAESLHSKCKKIGRQSGMDLLAIPLTQEKSHVPDTPVRFVFGRGGPNQRRRKTVLVMGATGSGKTTLINGMINYILGVGWEDTYRFKLIHEQMGTSQAYSQTQGVTVYDIHWTQGMRIDYSLTIVDTPGYGDTKGLNRDKEITESIAKFFKHEKGIQELDAVGFVTQASLPRLTPTQVYIFNSVLAIFGNDIKDNITLLITFADGKKPPVLSAVREADIPCPKDSDGQPLFQRFNNSALFCSKAGTRDPMSDQFNAHFWKMGMENFESFFAQLDKMKTQSLSLSRQVLDQRKRLEATVEGLQQLIQRGLVKMEEIRKIRQAMVDNQAQIEANVDVQIEVEVTEPQKIDISHTGRFLTNCSKCHVTCHYPCAIPRDEDKAGCAAMTNGICHVCPERCIWNIHFNQPYRWEYVTVKKTVSSDQIKEKYGKLKAEKLTVEQTVQCLEKDLQDIENKVLENVETVASCIRELERIALRQDPLTTTQHIDLMIAAEQQEKKPGFKERVESLRKLRQKADITDRIRTGQSVFAGSPSNEPSDEDFAADSSPSDVSVAEDKYKRLFM